MFAPARAARSAAAIFVLAAGAVATQPAAAETPKLLFAVSAPAFSHVNVHVLGPWAKRVNAEAKGSVFIETRFGTGITNARNFYDRMMSDVVQAVWGTTGEITGKFPLSQVVTLPYLAPNGEIGSVAFWRLFASGLLDKEYADVKLVMVNAYPQYGVHLRKAPAKPLEDLKGLRMIVTQRSFGEVTEALGGAPMPISILDIYSTLQRGAADGVISLWTLYQPFKLGDVIHYVVDGKLGSAAGALMISKKRFDALPEAARKVIDANSGEAESRAFGKFWDEVADEWREKFRHMPGRTIGKLSPATKKRWEQLTRPLVERWAHETPGGEKVLAAFRRDIVAAEDGTKMAK